MDPQSIAHAVHAQGSQLPLLYRQRVYKYVVIFSLIRGSKTSCIHGAYLASTDSEKLLGIHV
jgi:hypothetical protein